MLSGESAQGWVLQELWGRPAKRDDNKCFYASRNLDVENDL